MISETLVYSTLKRCIDTIKSSISDGKNDFDTVTKETLDACELMQSLPDFKDKQAEKLEYLNSRLKELGCNIDVKIFLVDQQEEEFVPDTLPKEAVIISSDQIEPSQELIAAIEDLTTHAGKTKELVNRVVTIAKNEGIHPLLIRELIIKSILKRGLKETAIRYYLPDELKEKRDQSIKRSVNNTDIFTKIEDNNTIEQTSSNNTESDDINETHDERSERLIQDEVKASMEAGTTGHAYTPEFTGTSNYKEQKPEYKIRFELQQEVEKLRQELESSQAINELLKGEIEASKNQAGVLATDADEIIKNLKIENEQLRHALTKHSFETASEIAIDPELVKNLEHMITHLESEGKAKQKIIEELNAKIESFSHLDHVVEHQPLDLDLTDKGGFLGQFFANRGKKIKVIHDGTKIKNIVPEVIK